MLLRYIFHKTGQLEQMLQEGKRTSGWEQLSFALLIHNISLKH